MNKYTTNIAPLEMGLLQAISLLKHLLKYAITNDEILSIKEKMSKLQFDLDKIRKRKW